MRVPLRYFLGLPLGLLLGLGFFWGLIYSDLGIPNRQSDWCKYLFAKKEAQAAKIQGPKLLLVGGSNVLFGLSARTIQEQTGHPTINLGTHAALGSAYILYVTEKIARPGDTVLLALEYELYDIYPSNFAYSHIIDADPDYVCQLSLKDKIEMAVRVPYKRLDVTKRKAFSPEPYDPQHFGVYTVGPETIDDFGDEIYNFFPKNSSKRPTMVDPYSLPLRDGFSSFHQPFANALAFCQWARAHHVTVLATFPNLMAEPEYAQPKAQEVIRQIKDFYASQGVPVLGEAEEVFLPADQFYDTKYHLTHEAAIARTARLVPYLKPYLNSR